MRINSIVIIYLLLSSFVIAQKENPLKFKADSLTSNFLDSVKEDISKEVYIDFDLNGDQITRALRKSIQVIPIPLATSENSRYEMLPLFLGDRKLEFLGAIKDITAQKIMVLSNLNNNKLKD